MIYSFLQNGDSAVTVQFKNEISEEVNRQVTGLCNRIEAKHIDGIVELVPTFASLTVFYDCTIISSKKLKKKVEALINGKECDVKSTAKVWNSSGQIASGNIAWDTAGNVTFGASVSLQWKNDIEAAKVTNFGYLIKR